jgi:hypothetical protein
MLVSTMNRKEVTDEFLRDEKNLMEKSFARLIMEYDKERKKLKIDKTKTYCKAYPIRTAAKNNWIVLIQKTESTEQYKSILDISHACIAYYHAKEGLRAIRQVGDEYKLEVCYGHLFNRYNQRLNLNLTKTADIITHFYTNNGFINSEIKQRNGKDYLYGVCKEGILLGNLIHDPYWVVFKTFISRDLQRKDQEIKEKSIMLDLEIELSSKATQFLNNTDVRGLRQASDIYLQIAGNNKTESKGEATLPAQLALNSTAFSHPAVHHRNVLNKYL